MNDKEWALRRERGKKPEREAGTDHTNYTGPERQVQTAKHPFREFLEQLKEERIAQICGEKNFLLSLTSDFLKMTSLPDYKNNITNDMKNIVKLKTFIQ